ncbi:MAG: hypothetical protein ACK559_00915, partial [bacterium]
MKRSTVPPRGPRRPRAAVHAPEVRPDVRQLPHRYGVLSYSRATATPSGPPGARARAPPAA